MHFCLAEKTKANFFDNCVVPVDPRRTTNVILHKVCLVFQMIDITKNIILIFIYRYRDSSKPELNKPPEPFHNDYLIKTTEK